MTDRNGELACVCKSCKHKWIETIALPMDIGLFGKCMKKLRCPSCAANNKHITLVFGTEALAKAGFDV